MIKEKNIDKLTGNTLRDSVYETLRKAIMIGELVPGERLMEIPLSERLGVSRTPVREAIKRLAKDDLVTITKGCGARVSDMTDKDVTDALDVRIRIEDMAVRLAARNITATQVKEIREINRKMSEAVKKGDLDGASAADNRLHHVICEAAGNSVLTTVHTMLAEHVLRYRIKYIQSIDDYDELILEHTKIIIAIETGDEEEASRLVTNHITKQRDIICNIIKKHKIDIG